MGYMARAGGRSRNCVQIIIQVELLVLCLHYMTKMGSKIQAGEGGGGEKLQKGVALIESK